MTFEKPIQKQLEEKEEEKVALPTKAGVEESPIGPPLDSDSSLSDFNSQSDASDDDEEEEKVPVPVPEP